MAAYSISQVSNDFSWEHLEYFKDEPALKMFIQNLPKSYSYQITDKIICDLWIHATDKHTMHQQSRRCAINDHAIKCPVRYKINSCTNNSNTYAEFYTNSFEHNHDKNDEFLKIIDFRRKDTIHSLLQQNPKLKPKNSNQLKYLWASIILTSRSKNWPSSKV